MSWFFIALFGTFLWSVGNFVDKVLTDRFASKWSGTWGLALYTSLFSLLFLPVLLVFTPAQVMTSPQNALILVLSGISEVVGIFLYLRALRHEDTSTVVPFFQIIPVVSFVLGFAILAEMPTPTQTLAGLGIIIGGVLLSLDISSERKVQFRFSLAALMFVSSVCFSLFDVLFKLGAVREGYWTGVFWQHVGIFLAGLVVFALHRHAREGFLKSLTENRITNISLNLVNELFYVGGVMFFLYALTLAPVALVATVNAFQPVFAFVVGGFLTLFFPKFIRENISGKHLFHKGLSIAIILIASVFLVS